jgi:hypothetical protein
MALKAICHGLIASGVRERAKFQKKMLWRTATRNDPMAEINEVRIEGGSPGHAMRTAQPTLGFRYGSNEKLQQAWLIVQCGDVNQEISREIEWRDVPNSLGEGMTK